MWTDDEVAELIKTAQGRAVFARWRARCSKLSYDELLASLEECPLPDALGVPADPATEPAPTEERDRLSGFVSSNALRFGGVEVIGGA